MCVSYDDASSLECRERILAAIVSLCERVQGEWLPIEDAPKDGRTLLLGYYNSAGRWRTMRGQWFTDQQIADEWEDPDENEAGWYETSVENDEPPNCWRTHPTRYRPLPLPLRQQGR